MKFNDLPGWIRFIVYSAIGILVFSIFSPFIFTRTSFSGIEFSENTGDIGDTIGGVMGPIVGISAALLTFAAFYIQYEANTEIKKQFEIQQIDKIFYQLLNDFNKNIENYEVITFRFGGLENQELVIDKIYKGKDVFIFFKREMNLLADYFENQNIEYPIITYRQMYRIFFWGLDSSKDFDVGNFSDLKSYVDSKYMINKSFTCVQGLGRIVNVEQYEYIEPFFHGHDDFLSTYYRQLQGLIKYIIDLYEKEEKISYDQTRMYLKILRSQLSMLEQEFLFYNDLFFYSWEKERKIFSKYRMVHNLYSDSLIKSSHVNSYYNYLSNLQITHKISGKQKDSVFQSSDW